MAATWNLFNLMALSTLLRTDDARDRGRRGPNDGTSASPNPSPTYLAGLSLPCRPQRCRDYATGRTLEWPSRPSRRSPAAPAASKTGWVGGWLIHHATSQAGNRLPAAHLYTPLHAEEGLRDATLTVKDQKWIPLIRGHMAIVTVAQFAWWKKQCAAV